MAFASASFGFLPQSLFLFNQFSPKLPFVSPQTPQLGVVRCALREWKKYEDAVKRKDLAGALGFVKFRETEDPDEVLRLGSSRFSELGLSGFQRDWEVLDTCLNADDMKLVGYAYKFLKDRGFLPNFEKFRNIASKFAPKKWGLSGRSSLAMTAFLGGTSFLLSQGIDIRPNLAAILGLAFVDSTFLRLLFSSIIELLASKQTSDPSS